jgi:hypothetical protein
MEDLDPAQYAEADRREVDPPIEVETATWSAGGHAVSSSPKRAMSAAMIGRRVRSRVRFCAASIHLGKIKE